MVEAIELKINKAIRMTVETGKIEAGTRDAEIASRSGKAKLVIVSSNCPKNKAEDLEHYCELSKIPMYSHSATSIELGSICGKPFPITALTVFDPGNSNLLELVKEG